MLSVVLGIWAFFIEPNWVVYKRHDITMSGWPTQLDGYKIAFITDLHVGSPFVTLEKLEEIVENTNALKPDLILLGGDYVSSVMFIGGEKIQPEAILGVLSKLRAKNGVYAVLGNHDYWYGSVEMASVFKRHGVQLLENTSHEINASTQSFWLAGISDFNAGEPDLEKAYAGIPEKAPVITLTHTPDIFPDLPERTALTLTGHTHGGQVYIPFFGRYMIPSIYGKRYAIGEVEESGRKIFISSGIGTSILPVRFLTLPEVSILSINSHE